MSASTSTSARPGTPFPGSHPSMPPFTHRRSSHPINFAIPSLPILTPPSLLKRSASVTSSASAAKYARYASSSSSGSTSSGSPRLSHSPILSSHVERRESTSSSSSSCSSSRLSPILSTPVFHPEMADDADVDVEIHLDTPLGHYFPSMATYQIETTAKSSTPSSPARPPLVRGAAVPLAPTSAPLFTRPKLTRRDTPRPNSELEAFSMRSSERKIERQGSYTSMMDGGKWVVV